MKQVITPGLVSVELFERVQTILRALSDKVHQAHALNAALPKFAYRGLLFCDCGQPLYTASGSQHSRYYRCRDRVRQRGGKGECKAPIMNQARLEAELDRWFSREEFTFGKIISAALTKQEGAASRKSAAKQREQLQARQDALAVKRERILARVRWEDHQGGVRPLLGPVTEELAANRRLLEELVEVQTRPSPSWESCCGPCDGFRRCRWTRSAASSLRVSSKSKSATTRSPACTC